MRSLTLEPLTAAAFVPYGDVLPGPPRAGERAFHSDALTPDVAGTRVSLHVNHVLPSELPFVVTRMERHPATSQTFLPLDASRYLVLVAGPASDGGPDPASIRGFWSPGIQGITYRRNVWHHGMVVLDRPARFAVLMWRLRDAPDDVFAGHPGSGRAAAPKPVFAVASPNEAEAEVHTGLAASRPRCGCRASK